MDLIIVLIEIVGTLAAIAFVFLLLFLVVRFLYRGITRNPTREKLEKAQLAKLMPRTKPDDDKP